MAKQQPAKSEMKVLFIVSYLLLWISGIVIYIMYGKKDKRIRFHCLQAIFLGIITFVLAFIPFVNLIGWVLWLIGLIIGAIAYNGRDISIPVIGKWASDYSK